MPKQASKKDSISITRAFATDLAGTLTSENRVPLLKNDQMFPGTNRLNSETSHKKEAFFWEIL